MAKRDYYEVLGVGKDANEQEIKKAYRQKAIQYHPDKNPGDKASEEKFKEAAEAYEILSNAEKKQRYDQYGHAGVGSSASGGYGGGMSMEDIFSHFGDIFGGGFGGGFGGFGGGSSRGGGRRVQRGSNLRVKVKLTLEEIAKGVEKKIKVRKQIVCSTCDGSGAKDRGSFHTCTTCNGSGQVRRVTSTFLGQMQTTATCPTCNGSGNVITQKCSVCAGNGVVRGEEIVPIRLPAGVSEGMQLSVSGGGNAAPNGGIAGDLIVVIEEVKHELFERDGNNLYLEHYIKFPEAVFGAQIEIPTLDGKARIKIDSGTQSGKVLRLKGKGLPELNSYRTGDLLVNINVWTPKKVSKEEKEALEKMAESENFVPKPDKKDYSFFERMRQFFN
ncbi:MAG: molecular chaperone DnaJ [Bacteroidales bacterium]|nr:molecular chaperone DnaJ [Bacteroidales bacterium]MDY0215824.1 molecular chaperone DnaJ [Bacteroidales bacterium]